MTDVLLADEAWKDVEPGTEALLDEWFVKEGDAVEAGQHVANVVLVKTNLEVVAPVGGVIERILVAEESTFARGQSLATIVSIS
jgi:pyruvate/2-oxoglutarate dehydrogenase complex dihydrolipoamide acyltransferase (E2) component